MLCFTNTYFIFFCIVLNSYSIKISNCGLSSPSYLPGEYPIKPFYFTIPGIPPPPSWTNISIKYRLSIPDTLTKWTVTIHKNAIVLNWTCNSDDNLSHFTIEKSFDGVEFMDAGIIFTGDTRLTNYSFKDKMKKRSINKVYYRLKITDKNNQVSFSDIWLVRIKKTENIELRLT